MSELVLCDLHVGCVVACCDGGDVPFLLVDDGHPSLVEDHDEEEEGGEDGDAGDHGGFLSLGEEVAGGLLAEELDA